MRDLGLVGLGEDRRHVVLRTATGEEFRLPVDDRLRAAIRGDRARLGQLEIEMDSALRPRDIQARIRRGESTESVAEAANVPVERIMAYAVPVLAEREHICERAQASTIRRTNVSAPAARFGDVITETFRARDVDSSTVEWDSWRREDGRWIVSVRVPDDGGPAMYLFDAPGRYVVADNERASDLVADVPDSTEMAIASAVADAATAVAEPEVGTASPDDEAPDPYDDIDEPGVTSLKRARARRAMAQEQLMLDGQPQQHSDETDDDSDAEIDPHATTADLTETAAAARAAGDAADPPDSTPKRSRRRERRRVPSWDEIMFGNKPEE
ncbi:septation protein SepH [Solicola gregarius]|uniref:Septation protein SepH n=1 Tax=Solicola gregarius TaxID=2908642 RepID=A0AA46YK31_9ACTN|nr:septation protein SepH [Solicola gregarius]UYM05265.1 septation protein SepH [Solicola gregarius]